MCARVFLNVTDAELAAFLEIAELPPFAPRYNVAPGTDVLAVHAEGGRHRGRLLRWGLVPHDAKDAASGTRLINVRSESVAQRPSLRDSLRNRRCIVPVAGFYEWKPMGGIRQPFAIRASAGLVGLAGLWDDWTGPDGRRLTSFALLTTTANERVAAVHDRMPVVLERPQIAAWLDPANEQLGRLSALLQPYPAERTEVTPVSTRVNRADVDDPACLTPAAPPPEQPRLF